MRPISVRFACFGPYMQEQYVNFEGADVLFLYSAGVLNNGTILK